MTPLGLLNFLVCQWLGFRVAKYKIVKAADLKSVALHDDGSASIAFEATDYRWCYRIMPNVVPLTGWWSDYRRIGHE